MTHVLHITAALFPSYWTHHSVPDCVPIWGPWTDGFLLFDSVTQTCFNKPSIHSCISHNFLNHYMSERIIITFQKKFIDVLTHLIKSNVNSFHNNRSSKAARFKWNYQRSFTGLRLRLTNPRIGGHRWQGRKAQEMNIGNRWAGIYGSQVRTTNKNVWGHLVGRWRVAGDWGLKNRSETHMSVTLWMVLCLVFFVY